MESRLKRLGGWFERRLHVWQYMRPLLYHPVPPRLGWWYVFGSATLTLFLLQIVTGICLALIYVPSADTAYESLEYLNYHARFGWVLRALHFWGSSAMVVMLGLHMTRVFLTGAFKYPRELTWIVGVVLLVLTLGMAFSGQVLRWDQDAYWGVGVGAAMTGRIPVIGPALVHLLLGGPIIGAATLSRFFVLHVFILTGLLALVISLHLYLVLTLGISARPRAGEPVDAATADAKYQAQLAAGDTFYPGEVAKDAAFSGLVVLSVLAVALIAGPNGPGLPADPSLIHAEPRPDWPFLPLFALLALSPPRLETFLMLGLPPLLLLILVLVPLVARYGERNLRRRPVSVLSVVVLLTTATTLGVIGAQAPWSPHMFAWSGTPVPRAHVVGLAPVQLQGAAVLQNKTCRDCHALDGRGGKRGPDLTDVAARLTRDELIRQVIQGGGLMPAYGKQLRPSEVDALVAFLETLHGRDQPRPKPTAE